MKKVFALLFLFIFINNSYSKGWVKVNNISYDTYTLSVIKIISRTKNIKITEKYLEKQNLLFFDIKGGYLKFYKSRYYLNDDYLKKVRVSKYDFNIVRVVYHLEKDTKYKIKKYKKKIIIKFFDDTKLELTNKDKSNKKLRIIIDPGHGGKDSGTLYKDLLEKNIVLKLAKLLSKELNSKKYNSKFQVILTRNKDVYKTLYYRRKMVQKYDADIFISLHVNDSPYNKDANGIEIFFVSEKAAKDRETEMLVRRENIADISAGVFNVVEDNNPLSFVLVDLTKRDTINKSIQLALNLEKSLKKDSFKIRSVKRAPFAVLKTLRAPAVLVEIGFISNKKERKKLKSTKYLKKIAISLAKGINSFFENTLKKVTLKFNEDTNPIPKK